MIRFTVGDDTPYYVNPDYIRSMKRWKTDVQGPTTRIDMVGDLFDYIVVDGTVEDNVERVREEP
jgi:hypothetical protein